MTVSVHNTYLCRDIGQCLPGKPWTKKEAMIYVSHLLCYFIEVFLKVSTVYSHLKTNKHFRIFTQIQKSMEIASYFNTVMTWSNPMSCGYSFAGVCGTVTDARPWRLCVASRSTLCCSVGMVLLMGDGTDLVGIGFYWGGMGVNIGSWGTHYIQNKWSGSDMPPEGSSRLCQQKSGRGVEHLMCCLQHA